MGQRLSTEEVHREMYPVYGFSWKTVFNWIQEFNKGRQSIRDQEHPGRPAEVSTEAIMQHVEQIIRNDQHVSIDDVARAVSRSCRTAYNIMHEQLKVRKVCARSVPRQLIVEQKMFRICLSLQHLNRYTEEGEDLMALIVTGDESWIAPFSTRIEKIFHGMETFHLAKKKKVQDDSISLRCYAHYV